MADGEHLGRWIDAGLYDPDANGAELVWNAFARTWGCTPMHDVPDQLRELSQSLAESVDPADIEMITSPTIAPTGLSATAAGPPLS